MISAIETKTNNWTKTEKTKGKKKTAKRQNKDWKTRANKKETTHVRSTKMETVDQQKNSNYTSTSITSSITESKSKYARKTTKKR